MGSPWPKQAVSASSAANRRNDATVCGRSWRRQCHTGPDRCRVTRAGKDRRCGRLVQFGRRATVVNVPMRQHDPVDARHRGKDRLSLIPERRCRST